MQILKTYYEPNSTFYPGNVGGAMIQTSDNNFALAFNYTGSGNSYGSLMKLDVAREESHWGRPKSSFL